jgi:hypothetical protein
MTAVPPDPDPLTVPGQEPGGGVPPGETPPDSAQTSGTSLPDPTAGHNLTPRAVVTFVIVALFIALFVATAVYLGIQIFT